MSSDDMQSEIDRLRELTSRQVVELNEARSMALRQSVAKFELEQRVRELEAIAVDRTETLELQRRQTERLDESLELQRQATESQVRANDARAAAVASQVAASNRVAEALEKIAEKVGGNA